MADQMRLGDALGVHEVDHGARERADVNMAGAQILGRAAMARQIQRIGGPPVGEGLLIELPVVEIAAEAVNEHDRHALALAERQIADAPAARLDGLGLRRRLDRRGRMGGELLLERGDVGVEVGIRNRGLGDHAQERADRHGLALADHDPAQRPRDRALEDVRDLRGLDVEDLGARLDLGAFLDQPLRDHPLLHRQAPLGHDDRPDRVAHRFPPRPRLSWPWSCAPPPRSCPGSGCRDPRGPARTAPARAAPSPSGSGPSAP